MTMGSKNWLSERKIPTLRKYFIYLSVYKGEEILFEINEMAKPNILIPLMNEYFCYGLENGNVGIYNKKNR